MFTAGRFQLKGKSHLRFLSLFQKLEKREAVDPRFSLGSRTAGLSPGCLLEPRQDAHGRGPAQPPPLTGDVFGLCKDRKLPSLMHVLLPVLCEDNTTHVMELGWLKGERDTKLFH